jgi:hypothetical protein
MANDLEDMFAEALSSDSGDDSGDTFDNLSNATIYTGDEIDIDLDDDDDAEIEVETDDDDTEVSDDSEDVDDDNPDDTDDGATDESEFDWATVKDQKVTIKVAGVESEVTLDELRNGYMRQADYTRGTQQIAELRKAPDGGRPGTHP